MYVLILLTITGVCHQLSVITETTKYMGTVPIIHNNESVGFVYYTKTTNQCYGIHARLCQESDQQTIRSVTCFTDMTISFTGWNTK